MTASARRRIHRELPRWTSGALEATFRLADGNCQPPA
jgi:hypothetical protein